GEPFGRCTRSRHDLRGIGSHSRYIRRVAQSSVNGLCRVRNHVHAVVALFHYYEGAIGAERSRQRGHRNTNRNRGNGYEAHVPSYCSSGTCQLSSIILMIPEKSFEPPPRSTKRWYSSSASPPMGVYAPACCAASMASFRSLSIRAAANPPS